MDAHSQQSDPRMLGGYRLHRRLGQGGMADVYLAEQPNLQRHVALKVLRGELAHDDNYVRRFHHEARAAASLVHPNIVQIYDVGQADGQHFIAQEYVPGLNLQQVIQRNPGPFPVELAVCILIQVAAALERAGEAGIVHRDIKPENIMLGPKCQVKVADFGLARILQTDDAAKLTEHGKTLGTPLYMSPEQIRGQAIDQRADLYSLGVTGFHLLTGEPPFRSESVVNVLMQHLNSPPPSLAERRTDLPERLTQVIDRLLKKEPSERYATAGDVLKELSQISFAGVDAQWPTRLLEASQSCVAATMQLDTVMRTVVPRRRRWLLAAVLAGVAFALGGVVGWLKRPRSLLTIDPKQRPKIERQRTVEDQFVLASLLNTERGWRAVAEYFPPKSDPRHELFARRAQKGLAELFLEQEDYDAAWDAFGQLVALEATEVEFRVSGLVGQANVAARRGDSEEAAKKLAAVVPLVRSLPEAQRRKLQDQAQAELDADLRRKFQATARGT